MRETALHAKIDPKQVHPCARNCVPRAATIPVLQKWIGHQSQADTQHYLLLAGEFHP